MRSLKFDLFDLREETGPKGTALKNAVDKLGEKFACDTSRKAWRKLEKMNVDTLRQAIFIRTDGKFVPVVFLAPPEDHYAEAIEDRGIFPVRGS